MKYAAVVLITVIKPLLLAATVDSDGVFPTQQRGVVRTPPPPELKCFARISIPRGRVKTSAYRGFSGIIRPAATAI
jgi:hypothetical protein